MHKANQEVDMLKLFRKNWFHILVWVLMMTYLIVAPNCYANFVLLNGKPTRIGKDIPGDSVSAKYSVDRLDPLIRDGQAVNALWGWAFLMIDPNWGPDRYERELILISDSESYFFPIKSLARQDVQEAFKHLNMDREYSGFSTLIAKDVLPIGKYRIGFVFKSQIEGEEYLVETNKAILRTPNNLKLIDFDSGS